MRIFVVFFIAIVAGSAAGSATSWFMAKDTTKPAPVSNAVPVANVAIATPVEDTSAQEARQDIERQAEAQSRASGGSTVLQQEARQKAAQQSDVAAEGRQTPVVEPPTVERAAPANVAPVTNAAPPPVERVKESTNYALPIAVGVLVALVGFVLANRFVSQDL